MAVCLYIASAEAERTGENALVDLGVCIFLHLFPKLDKWEDFEICKVQNTKS